MTHTLEITSISSNIVGSGLSSDGDGILWDHSISGRGAALLPDGRSVFLCIRLRWVATSHLLLLLLLLLSFFFLIIIIIILFVLFDRSWWLWWWWWWWYLFSLSLPLPRRKSFRCGRQICRQDWLIRNEWMNESETLLLLLVVVVAAAAAALLWVEAILTFLSLSLSLLCRSVLWGE